MPDNKLNLNKKPSTTQGKKLTPEELIAHFYNTMANCCIDISMALRQNNEIQNEMLIEMSDIKDNMNKQGLKEGWLNEVDIQEREKESDDDEGTKVPE